MITRDDCIENTCALERTIADLTCQLRRTQALLDSVNGRLIEITAERDALLKGTRKPYTERTEGEKE